MATHHQIKRKRERSVYLLKPAEGLTRAQIINASFAYITRQHLELVDTKMVLLTPEILHGIYPGLNIQLRTMMEEEMMGKVCPCIQIEGVDAVQNLVEIMGVNVDPHECAKGTFRRDKCILPSVYLPNGEVYHYNVVHRPKTPEEALRDMKILGFQI